MSVGSFYILCECKHVNIYIYFFPVDPPKVIQHPISQSVPTGANTTFTVEATGNDLIFHWQKNGRDMHNGSN